MVERRDLTQDPDHIDLIYEFSELDRKLSQLRLRDIDPGELVRIGYRYIDRSDKVEKSPIYTLTGYCCGFDIETSTIHGTNLVTGQEGHWSAMYCAQMSINNRVILCRTWDQVRLLWDRLPRALDLSPNTVLLTWVHNLDYETSYIKHRLPVDIYSFFGKSRTKPIKYICNYHIYLHDSACVSNSGLAKLAEMYNCKHQKLVGDIDHDILRNSSTVLTDKELGYICNDVLVLSDFARTMFDTFLIPKGYIPDTSTQILRKEIDEAASDPELAAELIGSEAAERITAQYEENDYYKRQLRRRIHGKIFGYTYTDESGAERHIPGFVDPVFFTPYTDDGASLPVGGWLKDGIRHYDFYKWLFRGGYTKSNARHTSTDKYLIDGIEGEIGAVDFTSSYPFCQSIFTFPMGRFYRCQDPSKMILSLSYDPDSKEFKARRYILHMVFKGLHSIDDMGLESESKCRISGRRIIDNGRVRYADELEVLLTDVDLALYGMYYTWDSYEVINSWSARAGRLPQYFLRTLWKNGMIKQAYKNVEGKEVEYALSKQKFNAAFGLSCKQPVYHDYKFGNDLTYEGYKSIEVDNFRYLGKRQSVRHELERRDESWSDPELDEIERSDYLSTVAGSVLSPYWGIWTTAYARYNLLRVIKEISDDSSDGSDVIYCDTDSVYYLNASKHQHIIDSFNTWAAARVRASIPSEYDLLMSLGSFTSVADEDSKGASQTFTRFKTLGAKRYIKTFLHKDGTYHTKVTVAGLPKGILEKHCEKYGLDIYRTFTNLLDFEVDPSLLYEGEDPNEVSKIKLGRVYHDELVKININGEIMTEFSSCTLYKTTFKLKMIDIYIKLIEGIASQVHGGRAASEIWRDSI